MSFKAKMFNRKASDPKNKPDQILETLELQLGQNIADIGAGGGYFSLRFAYAIGKEGKVYAVDTNPEFLEFIRTSAKEKGFYNVETILATEDRLDLPEKSLDLVFMRNVTHHLSDRVEYFRNLSGFLKPQGKIAIIEYKKGGLFSFRRIFGHYIPNEIIVEDMKEAGYRLDKKFDFLSEQSFTIFSLKK
ncbi:MAG: class I SAM-dependent methyltransferase [Candidatus Methylarchaceae archaeon HK02M1]|nr:class I SAM-dependent methyltransferase [Candidatus Methylarchaceae archaeon HK02M1]